MLETSPTPQRASREEFTPYFPNQFPPEKGKKKKDRQDA